MSIKSFILFSILTVAVLSCNESQIKPDESLVEAVSGIWQGMIPCADCPGIEYKLELKSDQTYVEQSIYMGEDTEPFVKKDRWEISKDSIITLTKERSGMKYFKFTGETIRMLDAQKHPIISELAEFYILERKTSNN
ncbi:MAG TPA: copper resistance protein NlpE [Balneolaceae bacterium]